MKHIVLGILTTVFLLVHGIGRGQNNKSDAHLTGHVIDATTKEHIPFATISVKGTAIGTLSDASGHFLLKNLPVGLNTIEVSCITYKAVSRKIEIQPNKTIEEHFELMPDALEIAEVVVTSSRNETKKSESATIVNVVGLKLFEKTASNNVAEVLNFQPGLRVEYSCSNCGVPQLRINGLEGQYSQILLDSRPIFSSLATVYGLEQLPTGMIERVEIIRGGGSALFGSNAIGGVVNIITKEPLRNSVTIANQTNIFKGGGTDVNTTLNASLLTDDYHSGVYLYGSIKDRDFYDRNHDSFSELPKLKSETMGFRGFHKFTSNSRLTVEYHRINEFRRGGNHFDIPPHQADIAEQLRHNINGGGLNYDFWSSDYRHRLSAYTSVQKIDRESYFGTNQNPDAYGKTEDFTFVAGGQYTHSFTRLFFMPAQLTLGTEYNNNKLHDQMLGYNRNIEQQSNCYGVYAQNEWKNKKWGLLLGGRLDKHNMVKKAIFSPRANLRHTLSDKMAFRLSYSAGYRAPQAYEEDLHVAAVGGEVAIISIDPNLRPEYSKSISGSVDLYQNIGSVELNLLTEGFYTHLDDVFTLVQNGHDDKGNLLLERRNASGAIISGVNFEFKTGFTRKLVLDAGLTLQKSRYIEPLEWSADVDPQRKMFRAPDVYGYASLNYLPISPLSLSLSSIYTGTMDVQHLKGYIPKDRLVSTPDFWDVACRIAYNLRLSEQMRLEISGGVKNIFDSFQKDLDVGVDKDAGFIYGPVFPRMLYFGVKFSL